MVWLLDRIVLAWRKRAYRKGTKLRRFLAPDVCREVVIVDDTEIVDGFVTAQVRTWNVLYVIRGLSREPTLGPPERRRLASLWSWEGARWGGPIPREGPGGVDPQ